MAGKPEGKGPLGCSWYFWRVIAVLLAILIMIVYILWFIYRESGVPFEALLTLAWLFSQEDNMPNKEVGPKTLERLLAAKDELEWKVEELGRQLGIPEGEKDKIYALIQIDEIRQLRADNDRLHREASDRAKEKLRFIRNIVRNIDGLLDRYLGK